MNEAPLDEVGEAVETPTAASRTATDDGEEPVETPTPEASVSEPVEESKEASATETPSSAPVADDSEHGETAAPETPATEEAPQNDGALNPPAAPDDDEAPTDDETDGIALLAVGDAALVWTVKDGSGQYVGGAEFKVEGPRASNSTIWTDSKRVKDCTSLPCPPNGYDDDPLPGRFSVTSLNESGTQLLDVAKRYRVQQSAAPSAYSFLSAPAWNEIPSRTGSINTPNPSSWSPSHDFGNFAVIRNLPVCEAGYIYGILDNGQIRQIAPNGSVTNFGSASSQSGGDFNGLGIGTGGEKVFAYHRTNSDRTANIWYFNTDTATWINTNKSANSQTAIGGSAQTVVFVAGAVALDTGKYYFGGFGDNGKKFRIWEYSQTTNQTKFVGFIDSSTGVGSSNNGDMAFDAAGNLYVVRGSGSTTSVFSVTKTNLQGSIGSASIAIQSAKSADVTTMNDVNGVAFDSDGKSYLGAGNDLRSYDMPDWSGRKSVTSSLGGSNDLASCSSPPTVTLEKILPGGRAKAADQFKLQLKQGTTLIGDATTEGVASGLQEERIGPLPVRPLSVLQISEAFVSGAVPSDYATSWRCSADGVQIPSLEGVGSNGTITIPVNAKAVVCQFTNSLLVASVTIHKDVVDIGATAPSPGPLWTVGTTATSTSVGTAMVDPAGTQVTNEMGDASWDVRFSSINGKADVTVFEEMQDGYQFVEGSCVVQPLGGSPSAPQTITNFTGQTLAGIGPGDTVSCTLLNKQLPASVEVNKQWTINGGAPVAHGLQPDGLTAALTLDPDLDAAPVWGEARTGFAVNDEVTIGETAALDSELLPGCSLGAAIISGDRISDGTPLGSGVGVALTEATNSYTITNPVTCKQELTLVKSVVNGFTGERLSSDWLLDSDDWDGELFAHMGEDASLTFDSAETKTVAEGEYVITETAMPNYVFDNLTCVGGDLDEDTMTVAVDLGQLVTCTFTNKDAPGSVTWTKVDETGVLLSGSEWKLENVGGDVATIVDCVEESAECTGYDKDPAAGQFKIEGLAWGEYSLVETKAPAGFVLNPDPHEFTISMAQGDYVFEDGIVNEQRDPLAIPMTGGLGSYQFWMTAGLFGVLAAGGLLWQRRGQRRTVAVLRN